MFYLSKILRNFGVYIGRTEPLCNVTYKGLRENNFYRVLLKFSVKEKFIHTIPALAYLDPGELPEYLTYVNQPVERCISFVITL